MGQIFHLQVSSATIALLRQSAIAPSENIVGLSALSDVYAALDRKPCPIDMLLLGPMVEHPVKIVQRLHTLDVPIAVLIFCNPDRYHAVRRQVLWSPFIRNEVRCWSGETGEDLAHTVADLIRRIKQRRTYHATLEDMRKMDISVGNPIVKTAYNLHRQLDHFPFGMLITDAQGFITARNRQAGLMLGIDDSDERPHPVSGFFCASDQEKLRQVLNARTAPDARSSSALLELSGHTEERRFIEMTASLVKSRIGAPYRMVFLQDVTERIAAEISLRFDKDTAEHRLRELETAYWHIRKHNIQEVLPICLDCGRVKIDGKQWIDVVAYLKRYTMFLSHGYCPECADRTRAALGLKKQN